MTLSSFVFNAKEYDARCSRDFVPPDVTLKELRDAIPKDAFKKSTFRGLYYVLRSSTMAFAFFKLAMHIDPLASSLSGYPNLAFALRWALWTLYWFLQSLVWGGLWTLAHEAGHGLLSPHQCVNHVLGFTIHTFLLVPYFAWRWTHHEHHKSSASLERDENYVPRTRNALRLPKAEHATKLDYHEIFEEAPIYTLGRLILMTLLGFQIYMLSNAMGSPSYPPGTNHINPWSPLFKKRHWHLVIFSDIGLSLMFFLLTIWARYHGTAALIKLYLMPYLLANHWVVILTFLQHSDPTIPHYRKGQWSFVRGALATVDRPLLGWAGRFFLHNISHDHTAHHLFSNVPFYNLPKVTKAIRLVLKDHYSYDSTHTFYALWRSFTQCLFVEDEGDIVFYVNKDGETARKVRAVDDGAPHGLCNQNTELHTIPDRPVTVSSPGYRAQSRMSAVTGRTERLVRRSQVKSPIPAAM